MLYWKGKGKRTKKESEQQSQKRNRGNKIEDKQMRFLQTLWRNKKSGPKTIPRNLLEKAIQNSTRKRHRHAGILAGVRSKI